MEEFCSVFRMTSALRSPPPSPSPTNSHFFFFSPTEERHPGLFCRRQPLRRSRRKPEKKGMGREEGKKEKDGRNRKDGKEGKTEGGKDGRKTNSSLHHCLHRDTEERRGTGPQSPSPQAGGGRIRGPAPVPGPTGLCGDAAPALPFPEPLRVANGGSPAPY